MQAQTIRGSCCPSLRRPQHHHRASRTSTTLKCSSNIPVLKSYSGSQITDSVLSYVCKSARAGRGCWYLRVFYRQPETLPVLGRFCPDTNRELEIPDQCNTQKFQLLKRPSTLIWKANWSIGTKMSSPTPPKNKKSFSPPQQRYQDISDSLPQVESYSPCK